MKDFRSALRFALPVLSLLSLAACGGGHKTSANTGGNVAWKADPTGYCPQVAVLQQAQTVTLFLPGRSDIAGQVSTGQITAISGSCIYKKQKKQHILDISFTTSFLADNGPANNGKPVTLPYFVAITKGNQIIDKQEYSITLPFDGNFSTAAATSKPVKIVLPPDQSSAQLEILVGLEMTPDQLAYAAAHPDAAP